MAVMGLDLSLTASGYAIEQATGRGLTYGTIKGGALRGVERLKHLRQELERLLAQHPQITHCLIEDYAMGGKGRTFHIGEWGGVARLVLMEHNITIYLAQPQIIKQYATGKGNAGKPQVIKDLYKHYGYDVDDDNEADAVVAALIARAIIDGDYPSKAHEQYCSKVNTLYTRTDTVENTRRTRVRHRQQKI